MCEWGCEGRPGLPPSPPPPPLCHYLSSELINLWDSYPQSHPQLGILAIGVPLPPPPPLEEGCDNVLMMWLCLLRYKCFSDQEIHNVRYWIGCGYTHTCGHTQTHTRTHIRVGTCRWNHSRAMSCVFCHVFLLILSYLKRILLNTLFKQFWSHETPAQSTSMWVVNCSYCDEQSILFPCYHDHLIAVCS